MASSIASPMYLNDGSVLEGLEIYIPKQTAIDKIGGILCHICSSIFGNKKDFESHYAQHGGGDVVYTCVACKKQISGYPSFRGHCYLNHVVKNKFQCQHCDKSFCKLSILNNHITAVHDYKCSSCDEKFTSKKDLQVHKIKHSIKAKKGKDKPPYDCLSCGKQIKTIDMCESHVDDHLEVLYPCPICSEVLLNKLEAINHLTKHFDDTKTTTNIPTMLSLNGDSSIEILGGILCCHCDMLFKNRTELDAHFQAKHEDKTVVYTCNICGKPYEKYELFGSHCHFHITKDKFRCDHCDKTFPRLSLLVIHTEAFHTSGPVDKPFRCEHCSHGFMTQNRLREHLRIVHEEDAGLRCLVPGCSATFERSKDLVVHQNNHKHLDNWCRQCGLQFVSLASAEKHLDVHRRKQFSCPVCGRECREKHLMVKHLPVHFEAVLHVCKICAKAYTAKSRFMQHLKTHSEKRSYHCTYCSKGFLKPHELQQHLSVHTGVKPYHCTLCPKTFTNYPNWSKHLTRMHHLNKTEIKKLKTVRDAEIIAEEPKSTESSPSKVGSGIDSAGAEMSIDFYALMESDDSNNGNHYSQVPNERLEVDVHEMNTICDPVSGELISVTDTVNAVIDRIDSMENLDLLASDIEFNTGTPEFHTSSVSDDTSDIKAIVEHIDAMSGEMEAIDILNSTTNNAGVVVAETDVLQFTEMMPVDNAAFNNKTQRAPLSDLSCLQPIDCPLEYGPDFINPGTELTYDTGLLDLDDHLLPHIDPLLTIRAEDAKMYVQNLNTFDFDTSTPLHYNTDNGWEPSIITKVYYEDTNDVNRMYIC